MNKAIREYIPLGSRQKLYLILVFVSLILLFYSAWQVKPVVVEVEDTLGLASHLTLYYWIGLTLLLATSIFAFLDRELKKDALFMVILIALGLFLVVLPSFIYENARESTNFYPFSEINNWLPTHHLDIGHPPHIGSYYSWPAFHFISASIVEITKVDFLGFAKYAPIFFMLCFIFTTYSIGRRLKLEPNRCFLLSFLALSSWLLITQHYSPRALGMVLFLLLFMLLLTPRRTVADGIVVILLFIVIVLTHSLTALAVLPAVILLSFYRKDYRFVALFITIFGAWYMYQAVIALDAGIHQWLTYPWRGVFTIAERETTQWAASTARIVSHTSFISYAALYAALMIGSIILLLMRRITGERRRQVISAFAWSIGVTLVMLAVGFVDALHRSYVFCLVPAACIIALSFSSRKVTTALMVTLMCVFVALHMPAEYGGEAAWGQVLTTEVKGSEFFALEVKPRDNYYYDSWGLIYYYDPNLLTTARRRSSFGGFFVQSPPEEVDLSVLNESHYVILSRKATDRWLFSWGEDPTATWPQSEAGQRADLIYNNGYFQIYENHLGE